MNTITVGSLTTYTAADAATETGTSADGNQTLHPPQTSQAPMTPRNRVYKVNTSKCPKCPMKDKENHFDYTTIIPL